MKPIPAELHLSEEEARGVQKYRELVQHRRREGHLRKHYAEVDRLFPGLDEETRHELALSRLRQALGENGWHNADTIDG